ncbi:MAG: Calx-beta domain-containing protein, partial [Chloroflexota bacterium]
MKHITVRRPSSPKWLRLFTIFLTGLVLFIGALAAPFWLPGQAQAAPYPETTLLLVERVEFSTLWTEQIRVDDLFPATSTDLTGSCPGGTGNVAALITAIHNANADPTADTITLAAGCTYSLQTTNNHWFGKTALPAITSSITIEGNGATFAGNPNFFTQPRFFYVAGPPVQNIDTGYLTLRNLTLTGGRAEGGDSARGGGGAGMGGAIFNNGHVELENVTMVDNRVLGGLGLTAGAVSGGTIAGGGGGIGEDASLHDGGGFGSGAPGDPPGGFGSYGVNEGGTGSDANTTNGEDGGIGRGGGTGFFTVGLPAAFLPGNGGFGAGGGAYGGNGGFGGGGGIVAGGTGSGLGGFGGGNGSNFLEKGGGGAGMGGAIFNYGGVVTLTNSTLSGNSVEGGSTDSFSSSTGGDSLGGAIFNLNGSVRVINSTIVENTARPIFTGNGGTTDGNAIYNLSHSAGGTNPAQLTLINSILANSDPFGISGGASDLVNNRDASATVAATVDASAPNIVEVTPKTLGTATSNYSGVIEVDPKLGPLANNGGLGMRTHMTLARSPAIDGGINSPCPAADERGSTRPLDADGDTIPECDLGAYELDTAFLEFLQNSYQVNENGTVVGATIIVSRTGRTSITSSVQVVLSNNTATGGTSGAYPDDYNSTTQLLSFAADEISKTVTIPINEDNVVEFNETLNVTLSTPANAVLNAPFTAVLEILDNDSTTLAITDVTKLESNAGTTFGFTVTLSSAVQDGVIVNYVTSDDTATTADNDYQNTSSSVNFTGTAGEQQFANVTVNSDTKVETDETFTVTLTGLNSGGRAITFTHDTGRGTIINDDSATLAITDVTRAEGDSGTTTFGFTVTLSAEVQGSVDVNYATSDHTATVGDNDYNTPAGSTLNFAAGETQKFVNVAVNGDTKVEADETFTVTLSGLNAGGLSVTLVDDSGVGTILNEDNVVHFAQNSYQVNEDGTAVGAMIVVSRTGFVDDAVSVDVQLNGGTATGGTTGVYPDDYDNTIQTLNFMTNEVSKTVTIPIVDDTVLEPTETLSLTLINPTNTLTDTPAAVT